MKRLFSTRFRTRGAASTPGGADPLVRGRRPRRPVESRKGPQPLQQERDGGVPRRPGGPPHRSGRIPSLLILLALTALSALAQPGQLAPVQPTIGMQDSNLKPALPGALAGVGIDQKLDQQVPLNLTFTDEAGRAVPLATFFHSGKPVILA